MEQQTENDILAAVDLGSNSFHMLMVKVVGGSVQVIGRVKRKVRLAAGLNDNLVLSRKAMKRGWECLSLFAERLQDIPPENIRIVGTATLRLAKNVKTFLKENIYLIFNIAPLRNIFSYLVTFSFNI